jgi:hypothetical protein
MANQKPQPQKVTIEYALDAFRKSVCFNNCKKEERKAFKCVNEGASCTTYKMFKFKLEHNG